MPTPVLAAQCGRIGGESVREGIGADGAAVRIAGRGISARSDGHKPGVGGGIWGK